jgi:integrase
VGHLHQFRPLFRGEFAVESISPWMKVIQQILRHANVTTTMNIYEKTVSVDAANVMENQETMCATIVQPEKFGSTGFM